MANRRLVVEHKDGRRVSVDEDAFDDSAANPFNRGGRVLAVAADGASPDRAQQTAARSPDEWQSLKAEGFKPTHRIDKDGHEVALKGDD